MERLNKSPCAAFGHTTAFDSKGVKIVLRLAIIGAGGMTRHHLGGIVDSGTQITVVCEPSEKQYQLTCQKLTALKQPTPPNIPDLAQMLAEYGGKLDAAFIVTPHAYHFAQASACLEAGLDVLLEKPMVMNADEALRLIDVRDRTGKLLVIAFQGGLSPQVRYAAEKISTGELGKLISISGTVWQNWRELTTGTWRVDPPIAGGGFLFDTGAHMLNTLSALIGEEYAEVGAWLDNRSTAVDILGVVIARTRSGALITIHGCGDAIPSCTSDIKVFTEKAIIFTGQWGEYLRVQKHGDAEPSEVDLPPMQGAWSQFVDVRAGKIANPCPPEVGLRMARLWDAIKASAAQGGLPVKL
jgi:predicted dehydrogenase